MVGDGTEVQFKFTGVLQEEKPLKDWVTEILMNCMGYYTWANGKFKIGLPSIPRLPEFDSVPKKMLDILRGLSYSPMTE